MGNSYRATSERATVLYGEDVFEADLSAAEESDLIAAGHLEIVPRAYRVLSNNFSAGKQGSVVELALLVEQEAALIQGGHIQRTTNKKG